MTRGNFLTIHFNYFGENAFAFARESSFTSSDYMTPANISRFGIKGSGLTYEGKFNWANWTRPVENWVCGYEPYLGVVIYDCIPSDKVFSFFMSLILNYLTRSLFGGTTSTWDQILMMVRCI